MKFEIEREVFVENDGNFWRSRGTNMLKSYVNNQTVMEFTYAVDVVDALRDLADKLEADDSLVLLVAYNLDGSTLQALVGRE